MFPRITQVKRGGRIYEYVKIVETYREAGKHRQRVLLNLGRRDGELAAKVDRLLRALRRFGNEPLVAADEIEGECILVWGPILVARRLWEQLRLGQMIQRHCGSKKQRFDVAETAFVLVANRLTEPSSEHGLARWLEHTFVCDRAGQRWMPEWRPAEEVTPEQRVKVTARWLNPWYRTLDALLGGKEPIERALFNRVKDLFHLEVELVLYDLTSTYFERRDPVGTLRRHGKSKDGRPRQVQVVVGVVMANGFPIAHHVFPGNQADQTTLVNVIQDLDRRFGLRRLLIVGDRGLVNAQNLAWLSEHHYRYLMAIKGRRNQEAAAVLQALQDGEDAWQVVDSDNRVQPVELSSDGVRYFVVESQSRLAYERELRERSMRRTRERLEGIAAAVSQGRLKDPIKIAARAARALAENHGARYFRYQVPGQGQFTFSEDSDKVEAEQRREGRYILKSDDPAVTPAHAVDTYKQLAIVEDGFRDLKDVLEMRPVWHKSEARIRAHVFVASLALFLKRSLQRQLDAEGVYLSATDALAASRSIGLADLDLNGTPHRIVARARRDAQRVLNVLDIRDIQPPHVSAPRQDG
jgi:hypothetical protein